jgi:hypothetical protein
MANQVGQTSLDFIVADSTGSDRMTVEFEVKASTSPDSAPVFLEPAGFGATLDLAKSNCIDIKLRVLDPDSSTVKITQDPALLGSTLQATGPMTATFEWCPDAEQAKQQEHIVSFWADDGDNPLVNKPFTIVVHPKGPISCPGEAPKIVHTAPSTTWVSSDPIVLEATITDDKGLGAKPRVYVSETAPAAQSPADVASMELVPMEDKGQGVFTATVKNPVAGQPAGTKKTLHYVIVAVDDDDPNGNCDHRSILPELGSFEVQVESPPATCSDNAGCPLNTVCEGTCRDDSCTPVDDDGDGFFREQNGCPKDHFCPPLGSSVATGHCAEPCNTQADCRSGQACKVFDTKTGCAVFGTKEVGDACTSFSECKDRQMCMAWNGGYCSLSNCDSTGKYSGTCPIGAFCYEHPDSRFLIVSTHWICLKSCQTDADCRQAQGYKCKPVEDDRGVARKGCLP